MQKVKYFDSNKLGRDFVVGDLHGCLTELQILLKHINFDYSKDRLFSVGDLVDRGPNSMDCAKLTRSPWFHAVRGNHEQMMIDSYSSEHADWNGTLQNWVINGGQWAAMEDPKEMEEVAKELDQLPFVIVIGKNDDQRVNIVHAELYRNKLRDLATDEDIDDWYFDHLNENNLIWGRGLIGSIKYNKEVNPALSTTFCGHTPVDMPSEVLNHKFIDLGACFWHKQQYEAAKLCIVNIKTNQAFILSVKDSVITEITV